MTVSSTTRKAGPFLGNGVTTAFPFVFKVFATSDLQLTRTTAAGAETVLTIDSDYSIALNADQDNNPGGTITYPLSGIPMAVGETLTGIGDLDAEQGTDLTNLGRFAPQVIENAFDYQTILLQQALEVQSRSLVGPVSDDAVAAIPSADDRAGMFLAFDANGNPVAASGTGADAGLRTDLAASTGSTLMGWLAAGAGAVLRSVQAKLRDILSTNDNGALGGGVSNDGVKLRALIADAPAGATILVKAGTYLLDQEGANPWCLRFNKRAHVIFEPGAVLKATTAGVRAVVRVSAAITHEGSPTIDGDYKTNHAVEVMPGAKGTTFRKWEGKNVTQQFNNTFSAAVFSVFSEVGVIFNECYAHDAVSYPNGTVGDTPGTARGFHFYGTAPEFGVNAVVNSRIDNIRNTNGLAGAYEDEDGLVSQMAGSFILADNNTFTNCMKRGIKTEDRGLINNNRIISTRTGADNTLETTTRMYSGISLYADDSQATRNHIGSGTSFGLVAGGSFNFGMEIGISGQALSRISAVGNDLQIGTSSNARGVEFVRLWGALLGLSLAQNTMEVASGPTITNVFGVRSEFDHATVRATVNINNNRTKNTTYSMQLTGGFSGSVSANHAHNFSGGLGGIVIDSSASALRPANVTMIGNCGYGVNDNTIRINDVGATGFSVAETKTESTTTFAVLINGGIRAYEDGSSGPLNQAQLYVNTVPAAGTFSRGDVALNIDPRDASPVVEWRCYVAGTPGTWRAVRWLVLRGATGSRPALTASDAGVNYLDTTLDADGKPIWWTGTAWVDATGAVV